MKIKQFRVPAILAVAFLAGAGVLVAHRQLARAEYLHAGEVVDGIALPVGFPSLPLIPVTSPTIISPGIVLNVQQEPSPNWAGYVSYKQTFLGLGQLSFVAAEMTVPRLDAAYCSQHPKAEAAFWVGMGGDQINGFLGAPAGLLAQTGIIAACDGQSSLSPSDGSVIQGAGTFPQGISYAPFIETIGATKGQPPNDQLPRISVPPSPIMPGDKIYMAVLTGGDNGTDLFAVGDQPQGHGAWETLVLKSIEPPSSWRGGWDNATAEVIAEDPAENASSTDLTSYARYGQVDFYQATKGDNGSKSGHTANPKLINGGSPLDTFGQLSGPSSETLDDRMRNDGWTVTPSALTDSGNYSSFTVTQRGGPTRAPSPSPSPSPAQCPASPPPVPSPAVPTPQPEPAPTPASPYSAARAEWEMSFSTSVPAAFQNQYLTASACDLMSASDPAWQAPISELRQLAAIPISSETPAQMTQAQADVSALDAFFGTPGLGTGPTPTSPPQGRNSPEGVTAAFYDADIQGNWTELCDLIEPSAQAACLTISVLATSPASGTFAIAGQSVQGDQALVEVTGTLTTPGPDPQTVTNSDPSSGMPPGAGSFEQAFAAASNSSANVISPVPCVEIAGVWYVDLQL